MFKNKLKKFIDQYFEVSKEIFGSHLPMLPYNEDEPSSLYVGEMDEEEWIQWQYVPVDRIIDFSGLEEEYAVHIPEELREYYNSYYFLELRGFWDNEEIILDKIDETTDVLEVFRCVLNDNGNMISIGTRGSYCSICVKLDSGRVISYDWEFEKESVLADSLSEFFSKLKPRCDGV